MEIIHHSERSSMTYPFLINWYANDFDLEKDREVLYEKIRETITSWKYNNIDKIW